MAGSRAALDTLDARLGGGCALSTQVSSWTNEDRARRLRAAGAAWDWITESTARRALSADHRLTRSIRAALSIAFLASGEES